MTSALLFLLVMLPETEFDLRVIPSSGDVRLVRVLATLPNDRLADLPNGSVPKSAGRELLQFSVLAEDGKPGRPMLGRYTRAGNTLTFAPRFPLVPGSQYRASLTTASGESRQADYRVRVAKAQRVPSAVVSEVYPTADVLPANSLKFYIHFSKPMRRGRAIFERIRLLDEDGNVIPDPWRRTELWTADDRRFTVWIHPGRVKQGVNLREEFGPVLKPGRTYSLIVDASVQDQSGQPLVKEYRREFRTSAEEHSLVQPREWKVSSPRMGTRDALRVDLRKPLDHALLLRCLEVHKQTGMLSGVWKTDRDDSVVVFRPAADWTAGEHQLVVDGILEDLAGNTPLRVFDTDLTHEASGRPVLRVPVRVLQP